jgi:hypothetical protein
VGFRGRVRALLPVLALAACGGADGPDTGPVMIGTGTGSEVVQLARNDPTTYGDVRPQLRLAAGNGSVTAVWEERRPSSTRVWAARFDGTVWEAPVVVAEVEGQGAAPDVAVDAAGDTWVVWNGVAAGRRSPFAARRRAGQAWGETEAIPATEPLAEGPRIAAAADELLAVWTGAATVWANRWTSQGGWTSPELLDAPRSSLVSASRPTITGSRSGQAMAVWTRRIATAPHGAEDLLSRRYLPTQGWMATDDVVGGWLVTASRPVVDEVGQALVVAGAFVGVALPLRFARSPLGAPWHSEAFDPPPTLALGQLAGDAAGNAIALLTAPEAPTQLYSVAFAPGTGWTAPRPLPPRGAAQAVQATDLAMASGEATAAWSTGLELHEAEYARGNWTLPDRVARIEDRVCRRLDTGEPAERAWIDQPRVVRSGAGTSTLAWAEFDCSRWTVWARRP